MMDINLCSPALIYLIFSMTQVIVDSIKGLYNVALLKFIMMVLFTLLLNILCQRGLGLISWIIVFVPFVLMSVITAILLFVFGLDPSSGRVIPPKHTTVPHPHAKIESHPMVHKKGPHPMADKKGVHAMKDKKPTPKEVVPSHEVNKNKKHQKLNTSHYK